MPDQTGKIRKLFLVAGEASGDLYGGQLIRALLERDPDLEIRAWGGDEMIRAGATVSQHYRELAYMGIWEIIRHLGTIRQNLKKCWSEIEVFEPDAFIGVDFPGFNLRIARKAKSAGIRTHHYISPAVWAWNKGRLKGIGKTVDRMHVVLPFEEAFYQQATIDVRFVGHPLVAELQRNHRTDDWSHVHKPILALLPGSRKQELAHLLPCFILAARLLPEFHVVIAGAPGQPLEAYQSALSENLEVVFGKTRSLLASADVGIIASGTATLEAALLGLPHVIGYKTSTLTYTFARLVAQIQWIGLANILLEEEVFQECIQSECTGSVLAAAIAELHDGQHPLEKGSKQRLLRSKLNAILGSQSASENVAKSVLEPVA